MGNVLEQGREGRGERRRREMRRRRRESAARDEAGSEKKMLGRLDQFLERVWVRAEKKSKCLV